MAVRTCDARGQHADKEGGQRASVDVVHRNLERQWREQGQRSRQQAEHEQGHQMPGIRPHLLPKPPDIRSHSAHISYILHDHYRRNRYLTPNWTVLAGAAELPRPKNGELNTPTILLMLVRLIALNKSTVISKLSRLSPPRRGATLKVFATRTSSCTVRGPRPVLR